MSEEVLAATEQKMKRTLEAMERDFQRVRTGGASASLIDALGPAVASLVGMRWVR